MGNAQLDLDNLKGFTLELNLDSVLEIGSFVSGSIGVFDFAAAAGQQETPVEILDQCVAEADIHFMENAPQFTRLAFLGAQCCELCAQDPDCLYAISTGFGHCYIASYLDPSYVRLLNNKIQQTTMTSIWMDDGNKRGDFCDRCDCH
jgi:hypothetical protein